MKKIDRKTTIKEALELPNGEEILRKYNLPCLSCPMASFEIESLSIGNVSEMYGLDEEKIIEELNK